MKKLLQFSDLSGNFNYVNPKHILRLVDYETQKMIHFVDGSACIISDEEFESILKALQVML